MRYAAPETLDAALALMADLGGTARVLAGGTDLLVQMRAGRLAPKLLVDVKRIPELRSLEPCDGGWRVGAAVTGMELIEHEPFAAAWPGIVDGVRMIGSIQVKGRATLGGNLCNASPAADSVPALIAAGAVATAGRSRRAPRSAGRAHRHRPRPHLPGTGRDPGCRSCCHRGRRARPMPTCASRRARRWTLPWWAPASTSRSTPAVSAARRG